MVQRSTRRSRITRCAVACVALAALLTAGRASAQSHRVELEFSPTKRVQMAVWVEKADGTFMGTLALTAATADRGIGNRPGALQMNSGYRWPYGRREGALPVWAHRRDAAPGAAHFRRVIFQDRGSEGYASQTSIDQSTDTYFCAALSTQASDSLDAVTCPSVFSSDKGRFITQQDVDAGYGEPFRQQDGANILRPLSLYSLYPPRRDVTEFGRYDHPDARLLAGEALRVMPNLDAITMATPDAAVPDRLAFALPADWPLGDYDLYIEVNTEADFNDVYDTTLFPTPKTAASQGPATWDVWAMTRGTPYRGQPSVVFRLPLALENGAEPVTVSSAPVEVIYDLVFGFDDGDDQRYDFAAGTCARGLLRMLFGYRGNLMFKMNAGMGDTIFTPLWGVLKARGVRFEMFRRVTGLELDASEPSAIGSIRLAHQATVKPEVEATGGYWPFVSVQGIDCWPDRPSFEQLVEGEKLREDPENPGHPYNLESYWTSWPDVGESVLERGKHFDHVLLGISIGALGELCQPLIGQSKAWQAMVEGVHTTPTQSSQLWLTETSEQLGWVIPEWVEKAAADWKQQTGRELGISGLVGAYQDPFNTWADMSHLLPKEDWTEPKSIGYLVGQAVPNVTDCTTRRPRPATVGRRPCWRRMRWPGSSSSTPMAAEASSPRSCAPTRRRWNATCSACTRHATPAT